MKNTLIAGIVCGVAAFSVQADTTWTWTGGGGDFKWSNAQNWDKGTTPVSNEWDTVVVLPGGEGVVYENDLAKPYFKYLKFSGAPCRIAGNALHCFTVQDASATQGNTWTFDVPLFACARNTENKVYVKPGNRFVWNALVSHEWDQQDRAVKKGGTKHDPSTGASGVRINWNGGGTNVFNGTYRAIGYWSNYTYSNYHDKFSGGTAVFNGLYESWWTDFSGGAHIVISPAAVLSQYGTDNWFTQNCTVDVAGVWSPIKQMCAGQATATSIFNVKKGGTLYATGIRLANNAPCELNVEPGGTVNWPGGTYIAESGTTVLRVGGRFVNGTNGGNEWRIGYDKDAVRDSRCGTKRNEVYLNAGGEVYCTYVYDQSGAKAAADRDVVLFLDGGRFCCAANREKFFQIDQLPEHFKAYVREGGVTIDVRNYSVTWNQAPLAEDGHEAGALVKYGAGTLTAGADLNAFSGAHVWNGTFAVADVAYWTKGVVLEPGAKLSFTGTTLSLAGLTSRNGTVALAAGQSLALAEAPVVDAGKALVFDLADAATDGAHVVLTLAAGKTFPENFAASCALLKPVDGKSCTFAVDGQNLVATVADGAAPAPASETYDLTPVAEDDGLTHVANNTTVTATTLDGTEKYALDGAASKQAGVAYAGTETGTVGETQLAGQTRIGRNAGAGDLAIAGPFVRNYNGTAVGNMYFGNSDAAGEIAFTGNPVSFPLDIPLNLIEGQFRVASGATFVAMPGSVDLRAGGTYPTKMTVEEDASVAIGSLRLYAPANDSLATSVTNNRVLWVQDGGAMRVDGDVILGYNASWPGAEIILRGGTFAQYAGTTQLRYGQDAIRVAGGAMTLNAFDFGNVEKPNDALSVGAAGAKGLVDVAGEDSLFSVEGKFSWIGSAEDDHYAKLCVADGGTARLPATTRNKAPDTALRGFSSLVLDGGTVALTGKPYSGTGDVADYFAGLHEIVLGPDGGALAAAVDATVKQNVRAVDDDAAFVKKGAGTLTLAATNAVSGSLVVEEGTLVAGLAADPVSIYPEGLLILWDFDGADPMLDKTGHGYDLVQTYDDAARHVIFKDATEGAHRGKAAYWPGKKESMHVDLAKRTSAALNSWTLNCWARLGKRQGDYSHQGFISTRPHTSMTDFGGSFEFCFKTGMVGGLSDGGYALNQPPYTDLPEPWIAAAFGVDKYTIQPGDWHMVTLSTGVEGSKAYFDGVLVSSNSTVTGNVLWNGGYHFMVGQGLSRTNGLNEFVSAGGMLDDVAVFARALSAEEIAGVYAATKDAATVPTPAVDVASGATWNMNGIAATTPRLSGAGTINGAALAVNGTLAPDFDAATTLALETVSFAKVPTLSFSREAGDPIKLGRYALFTFGALDADSEALLKQASASDTGHVRAVHAEVTVDRDAQTAYVDLSLGTVLIVR